MSKEKEGIVRRKRVIMVSARVRFREHNKRSYPLENTAPPPSPRGIGTDGNGRIIDKPHQN